MDYLLVAAWAFSGATVGTAFSVWVITRKLIKLSGTDTCPLCQHDHTTEEAP